MVIKKLLLTFFVLFVIIFTLFSGEVAFRIKYLGAAGAMQSLVKTTTQPSVLGTSDWVISDPDLNYKFNPARSGVNRLSMLGPDIIIPKPLGLTRIAVLGDSIPATGNPNFVDLLRSKFSNTDRTEVLNAGTPGYTTYQELIFLEKYLIKAEPDIVILSYCLNDNYMFLHHFDTGKNMLWTKEAEDSLEIHNKLDEIISKSYLLTSVKLIISQMHKNQNKSKYWWDSSVDFNIAWKDYAWPDFADRLSKINSILEQHHGKLIVVVFPLESQLDKETLSSDYQYVTKPQRQVSFYSNKLGIPNLDMFPVFYDYAQKGKKLFTDGIHLSLDGENIAANSIYNFILNGDYLPDKTVFNN
jgi:lysophospholipase L1-like esterase